MKKKTLFKNEYADFELPSNRKFGILFTIIFTLASLYFYSLAHIVLASLFLCLAIIVMTIALVKANILLPANKLWMQFGIVLGMIVSPIVLGIIFFGLFTPISVFLKLRGRDELRLKVRERISHWNLRGDQIEPPSFKNQF